MNLKKILVLSFLSLFIFIFQTSDASAKVMWGKTELKKGQIGKVTILSNVNAAKINGNTLTQDKRLKKGDEYRIYSYRVLGDSSYYGLGGGLFVKKSASVKYETPSKKKLAELEREANGLSTIDGIDFTKIYEVKGTGEYKGYKRLKGYPDDDKYAIYYSGNFQSFHVTYEDLYPKNLKEKITWKYNGKKYTHTRSQLYSFFSDIIKLENLLGQSNGIINQDWLLQTFGDTYKDWLLQLQYSSEAASIVEKYLNFKENPNQVDDLFENNPPEDYEDAIDLSIWISSEEMSVNGDDIEIVAHPMKIGNETELKMTFLKGFKGVVTKVLYHVPDMPLGYFNVENDSEDTFNGIRFKKVNKNVYINREDLKAKGVL
ncbi:hypothetical protein [Cytobacillus praedii]|uniref:hypothetical protein n=1 Tax=Cytobacillus praedii TaxID=1742358 RepID=UPI002E22037C|nr:hypothetical protein [Cytobacillus praedii]